MPTDVARQTGQDYRDALEARGWLAPTPRYLYDELRHYPDQLADLIVENFEMRRAQMMPRDIVDVRMLRLYDPEKLQDHWSNPWTGSPLKKLSKKGKAIEIFPWAGSIGDTLVALMSGRKPFAYAIDVEPNDAASDADAEQADGVEGWLYREQVRQRYPLTYQDAVGWTMLLGRNWKAVTTDTKTRLPLTEVYWPSHVAAFWQDDMRTIEQAIVMRNLTLGEAVAMYAPKWATEEKDARLKAAMEATVTTVDRTYGEAGLPRSPQRNAHVSLLCCYYRMGDGKYGEQIDQTTVLMGTAESEGKHARATIVDDYPMAHEERGDGLGFPLYCTPRIRILDKPPDEATGFMVRIAGAQVWYNEVLSSSRDMLSRTIYPRLKAKGFTFRNAPRFIQGSAMYAMPREGQDIQRIEETMNTTPLEQVMTRLEENAVIHGGLNRIFLQSAPTSELSGDAIDAALTATSGRHEPTRTEVAQGEMWTYAHWLAEGERWTTYTYDGKEYPLKQLIDGKREVVIYWADMIEIGKVRQQQMALAGRNGGVVSDDFTRDKFGVRSKVDEVRKIRKERQDVWLHPEHVSQAAAAMIQLAEAKRAQQGGGGAQGPQTRVSIALAGALSPEETASAAALAGIQGAPPTPADVAGGTRAILGRQPVEIKPGAAAQAGSVAAEAARTAAARAAPPSNNSNNQPGGAMGPAAPGQNAPQPPTQPSNIAPTARPGGQ